MRTVPLRVLTWGTVVAAVSSAVWLSTAAAIGCTVAPAAGIELDDLIAPAVAPAVAPSPAPGPSQ